MPEVLTADRVTIVYDDLGPRAGTPVVLCHGLAAAGEQLAVDARYFAELGYRVLVPDLRGHGRSGTPAPALADGFSIPRMAADLTDVLDHAGVGPVHWVGNSLGGILALFLLEDQAARLRTLATFGTCYRLRLPRWVGRLIPLSYGLAGAPLTARLGARLTTRNRSARPLLEKLLARFDPDVGRLVAANLASYDLRASAMAARLPILLLRGGRDTAVNAALGPTLRAMRGRPDFTVVELPEAGHCANLDATAAWRAALLGFWRGR